MSKTFIVLSICVSFALFVVAQQEPRRCFQYTWLGPRYNNDSVFMNATCAEATRLSSGVPCQEPLVASYDGSWPDVEYIWRYHTEQASCILADNDVCAQYTYYFNGIVENSTHMCTRAVDSEDGAITSGCYQQRNGSWTTKVCLCRSIPGGVPCNTANTMMPSAILFSVTAIIAMKFVNYNYKSSKLI